jgi:hypothetical protein
MTIKIAITNKKSIELNGSMFRIAGKQIEWMNQIYYLDDYLMENIKNIMP